MVNDRYVITGSLILGFTDVIDDDRPGHAATMLKTNLQESTSRSLTTNSVYFIKLQFKRIKVQNPLDGLCLYDMEQATDIIKVISVYSHHVDTCGLKLCTHPNGAL